MHHERMSLQRLNVNLCGIRRLRHLKDVCCHIHIYPAEGSDATSISKLPKLQKKMMKRLHDSKKNGRHDKS